MSHSFYDQQWRSAIEDLQDVIQLECPSAPPVDPTGKEPVALIKQVQEAQLAASNNSNTPPPDPKASKKGRSSAKGKKGGDDSKSLGPTVTFEAAFQHWASIYVRYMSIYRRLEDAHDQIVQPQKRRDLHIALETVLARMLQIRADLTRVANKGLGTEYLNLEETMLKQQITPAAVECVVPKCFREKDLENNLSAEQRELREYMDKAMQQCGKTASVGPDKLEPLQFRLSRQHAILIIQRHERGRQGAAKAAYLKEIQTDAIRRHVLSEAKKQHQHLINRGLFGSAESFSKHAAAVVIQRNWRGYRARVQCDRLLRDELVFIGMRQGHFAKTCNVDHTSMRLTDRIRATRKLRQINHELKYVEALKELQESVKVEDGPRMKEEMWEERYNWWIEQKQLTGVYPENFEEYYRQKEAAANPVPVEEDVKESKGSSKRPASAKPSKEPKGGKEEKKAKKSKSEEEDQQPANPFLTPLPSAALQAPLEIIAHLQEVCQRHSSTWGPDADLNNPDQIHDDELAKSKIRPLIREQIRLEVDQKLSDYLLNIRKEAELAAGSAAGASKSGKKGKGKKGKKGDGKSSRASSAKRPASGDASKSGGKEKKGKKSKAPKPTKTKKCCDAERACIDLSLNEMVLALAQAGILQRVPRPATIGADSTPGKSSISNSTQSKAYWKPMSAFVGDMSFLGGAYEAADIPVDPSMSQVRDCAIQYGVLPLGSLYVKAQSPLVNSLLFYGPAGTGKTLLSRAIGVETPCTWIDFSPRVVEPFCSSKAEMAKLIHMVFTVAKVFAPSVIYLDEAEKFFLKSGKKRAKSPDETLINDTLSKLRPYLLAHKLQLSREHQVLIIGNSREPFNAEVSDLANFFGAANFGRMIHTPLPNCETRLKLWTLFINERISEFAGRDKVAPSILSTIKNESGTAEEEAKLQAMREMEQESIVKDTQHHPADYVQITLGAGLPAAFPPEEKENLTCVALSRDPSFNVSTLAYASEGYSAGSIQSAVNETLTSHKVLQLLQYPVIGNNEFLENLAKTPFVYKEDALALREFELEATGEKQRRKLRDEAKAMADEIAAKNAAEKGKRKKK